MATHCSILAWRIPWTEEPEGLQSTESQRIGQDCVTDTFTFTFLLLRIAAACKLWSARSRVRHA